MRYLEARKTMKAMEDLDPKLKGKLFAFCDKDVFCTSSDEFNIYCKMESNPEMTEQRNDTR